MNYKGKKGVDISSVNGDVDIQKIKDAGYDFVMIHCGFGSDIKSQDDSQFENNVRKCEKIGMPWGTYLYSYALNTDEAKSEAEHVIRLLKNKKPSFPVDSIWRTQTVINQKTVCRAIQRLLQYAKHS